MESKWKQKARHVITNTLLFYEAECLSLGKEFCLVQAFYRVSRAYPFGERAHHPYKQWLTAVREARSLLSQGFAVRDLTLIDWDNALIKTKKEEVLPGQLAMW